MDNSGEDIVRGLLDNGIALLISKWFWNLNLKEIPHHHVEI